MDVGAGDLDMKDDLAGAGGPEAEDACDFEAAADGVVEESVSSGPFFIDHDLVRPVGENHVIEPFVSVASDPWRFSDNIQIFGKRA